MRWEREKKIDTLSFWSLQVNKPAFEWVHQLQWRQKSKPVERKQLQKWTKHEPVNTTLRRGSHIQKNIWVVKMAAYGQKWAARSSWKEGLPAAVVESGCQLLWDRLAIEKGFAQGLAHSDGNQWACTDPLQRAIQTGLSHPMRRNCLGQYAPDFPVWLDKPLLGLKSRFNPPLIQICIDSFPSTEVHSDMKQPQGCSSKNLLPRAGV